MNTHVEAEEYVCVEFAEMHSGFGDLVVIVSLNLLYTILINVRSRKIPISVCTCFYVMVGGRLYPVIL